MRLDVLADADSHTVIHAALGGIHATVDAGWAVTELISLCAGFPLAFGLVAARIRCSPTLLHDFITELRDLGLDALDSDDPAFSLPTVWSLCHLTEQQRTVFGLLGIAPAPTSPFPRWSLADLPQADARRALLALEEASLLERRPGDR